MKNKIILFSLLFLAKISFANNLQISSIVVTQASLGTGTVAFTLSWNNSWNVASAPANWDAAWVFVKWRLCTDGDGIPFTHGTLDATTAHHSYTNLTAMTSVDGTVYQESAPQGATLDMTDGIMLKPTALALGSISSSVVLTVANLPASGTDVTVSVFGIEMVYVPQGNFTLGDADGSGNRAVNSFLSSATVATALPMSIDATYETGAKTFYLDIPTGTPTTISNVPAAFPKGQYGFYMMKYEITEGLYSAFLNSIGYSSAAATARYLGNYTTNRNQLNGTTPPYVANRPDRAQNFLSWPDVGAFLDWACLRPMTEMEFEKACIGRTSSVKGEYAWGSTIISTGVALTFTGAGTEDGTETTTAGNCVYGNPAASFSNGDNGQGPSRVGIFATASSTRVTAGSSYYGVMELSGNLREPVVALQSDVAGATGNGAAAGLNVFTRSWGNGSVSAVGTHPATGPTTNWPVTGAVVANTVVTNVLGHRGGAWNNAIAQLQVSDRNYVYTAPTIARQSYNGGRGVR